LNSAKKFPYNNTSFIRVSFFSRDEPNENDLARFEQATKSWELHFLKSPTEIIVDDNNQVAGIRLQRNRLIQVTIKKHEFRKNYLRL